MKRVAALGMGMVFLFLGLLWFLQGTGIIHLRPVLCVADCEVITGTSLVWTIIGAITFISGVTAIYFGIRNKNRSPGK